MGGLSAEPSIGARLGRYRLLAPIGSGGMGRVWAALDEAAADERLVAIKLALGDEGVDSKFLAALSDEAAVAARIQHPNVCATFELGRIGDLHFLVMELSDGASLRELMDALPEHHLPLSAAVQIGVKVAAGLHAAHELTDPQGNKLYVVHRDVSPQNVLIDRRGRVRLADFGVAKARGQLRGATQTGEIKGKLGYMAPEQITSRAVDARADVFALGCVVYEASLGQRPFPCVDALSAMYSVLEEPARPPRDIDANFPEQLEHVLLKALEKDPAQRYQSAAELQDALVAALDGDLTAPGDRHVAKLLDTALGDTIARRNLALSEAAERARRGQPLLPPSSASPHSVQSITPAALAVTRHKSLPPRGRGVWIAVALVAVASSFVAWSLGRSKPSDASLRLDVVAASKAVPTTVAATVVPPAPLVAAVEPVAMPVPSVSAAIPRSRVSATRSTVAVRAAAVAHEPVSLRDGKVAAMVAAPPVAAQSPRAKVQKAPRSIDESNPFKR